MGFEDADVLELESSCPTPQLQTIDLFLSASAGMRQEIYQGDLEEAFLQGKQIKRLVLVRQPPEGVPGLHPDQLLRMDKEVYGTIRGPASWRESVVDYLVSDLGYVTHPLDACAFTLPALEPRPRSSSVSAINPFCTSDWLVPRPPEG